MLASVKKPGIWFGAVVLLALFSLFLDRPRIPDLDELLAGALNPVVEMETRRR